MTPAPHPCGEILRMRRNAAGLTQRQLVDRIGIKNRNFITLLESGRITLPLDRVPAIATALGLDPLQLLVHAMREHPATAGLHDWMLARCPALARAAAKPWP